MAIKPAEDMIAIEYLDGEEAADDARMANGDVEDFSEANALMATVVAVGPGVKVFKTGQTVLVRPWTRWNVRHEKVVLAERWNVLAAID